MDRPAVFVAEMRFGGFEFCTECQACYAIILREGIDHNCPDDDEDTEVAEELLFFVENMTSLFEIDPAA